MGSMVGLCHTHRPLAKAMCTRGAGSTVLAPFFSSPPPEHTKHHLGAVNSYRGLSSAPGLALPLAVLPLAYPLAF